MEFAKVKVLPVLIFTFTLCICLHLLGGEVKADSVVSAQQNVMVRTTSISTQKTIVVPKKEVEIQKAAEAATRVDKKVVVNENSEGSIVVSGSKSKIISFAFQFIDTPYVYGASGPKAFDCSGFTAYVYNAFGVSIPHFSGDQATMGGEVSKTDLQAGDIVYFNTTGTYISHVGIYIGNGQFIHASSGKGKVTISSLDNNYYLKTYRGARRLID